MDNTDMDQLTKVVTTYMVVYLVIGLVLIVAETVLVTWALIDAVRRPMRDQSTKALWILAICFIPIIGPIVYLSVRRNITEPVVPLPPASAANE